MRTRALLLGLVSVLTLVGFTVLPHTVASSPVTQAPRNLSVLVGGGQDTTELLSFFPMNVQVRQGDTITWRINSDEIHTVTLARGASPAPDWGQWPNGPGGALLPP